MGRLLRPEDLKSRKRMVRELARDLGPQHAEKAEELVSRGDEFGLAKILSAKKRKL